MSALTFKTKYTAEPTDVESRFFDFVDFEDAYSQSNLPEPELNRNLNSSKIESEYLVPQLNSSKNLLNPDKVLSSDNATIFEVLDETVRVKTSNGIMINIPRLVFVNKEDVLKYGQQIIYSIKIRPNGFRYQDFEIDSSPIKNPYADKVIESLNKIKNER